MALLQGTAQPPSPKSGARNSGAGLAETSPGFPGTRGTGRCRHRSASAKGCAPGEKQSNKGVWCDSAGASVTARVIVLGASTYDIVKVPVGGDPRSHWGFPDVRFFRLLFSHSELATPR